MQLPLELIDHVFSFLQEDASALDACSKAHPLYSRLAEPYLYTHIVIDPQATEVCNLIVKNPRLLDYPRTLEIHTTNYILNPLWLLIMSIIPRMANLISLKIHYDLCPFEHYEEFILAFRNCLQSSPIEQLYLHNLYNFPLSVLDDAKNIKQLGLSNCSADEDEPISSSPSSQLSLETLVVDGDYMDLHRWAIRWVTRLTTLELRDLSLDHDWTAFPKLLVACSNSLTRLRLDFDNCYYARDNYEIPFTLSALTRLKKLSIFALIIEGGWSLHEMIRFVKTAPTILDVVLRFHCCVSDSIGRLDWSLIGQLQSDSTGTRPRINLCVTGEGLLGPTYSPEDILDDLAENEVLMDLVKRGLVVLGSERTSVWGD